VTRSIYSFAVLLAIGLSAAGCVTSRAQIPEEPPTLVVPPVPPRTIDPPPVVEPPVEPPPAEPAPAPAASTTKQNKPRPVTDSKPDPKQEPPPDVVATVPTPPPVAPLRTPATPTGPEAARQIKEIIESTQKLLDKAEQQQLSDDRKANLTQARAFIQQAEEAIKKDDLTLARSLAERAQNIGKLLTTR
jgi:hypothetical protein